MVKGFDQYINESGLGAITIERKPIDKLNQPDTRVPIYPINTGRVGPGRTSSIPYQWGHVPLSFGSNPLDEVDWVDELMALADKYAKIEGTTPDVILDNIENYIRFEKRKKQE